MSIDSLQDLCEQGQRQLSAMHYLQAEKTLAAAEAIAWESCDWDALSRLYMPLQETRRQRRQRCGEGLICLDLLARHPDHSIEPEVVLHSYPHGQLLIAGWGSVEAANSLRRLADERQLYVETFLAAAYPVDGETMVAIVPIADARLPEPTPRAMVDWLGLLPAHSVTLAASALPARSTQGSPATYANVMGLWERLHLPFLQEADALPVSPEKVAAYRHCIAVDYACEKAHQHLSDIARQLARG